MAATLAGLRIVVTRARHQAEQLARPLRERGANVVLVPLIGIGPAADRAPLQRAAERANEYDWILFSSANAVAAFAGELPDERRGWRAKFAAVGDATRLAAEKSGFPVALVPHEYVAEALAESFAAERMEGARVLMPSAALARDVIPEGLRAMGAQVDVVEAYRNVVPPEAREQLREALRPCPDWVTFASPSAVGNAIELAGATAFGGVKIASIGPVTSKAVRAHGLTVEAEAEPHTVAGLVAAIENAL